MKRISIIAAALFLLASCGKRENRFDASGSFETEETIISSQASGTIEQLNIEEGMNLNTGEYVGYIDTTELFLKKEQLLAQINAVLSQRPNIPEQLGALQSQLAAAEKEQQRFTRLVAQGAAPQKQLDDITAQVRTLRQQIEALRSSLNVASTSISEQATPLRVQIDQINEQISRAKIINPFNGTVLAKYANEHEVTVSGKPLYKLADLSYLILRAYITGDQLPYVRLNQRVAVFVDSSKDSYRQMPGTITWISDQSEFTPKTIQTKDERANLVYAIKIRVNNDGSLKDGMYAEVKFSEHESH
jgi:HlyD family secretion protein